jgi:hypothetical protein
MQHGKNSISSRSCRRPWQFLRRLVVADSGAALIFAVVTLIVLTVLGIAALTSTDVELKVARGEKAFDIGFYNAEASVSITADVLEEGLYLRGLAAGPYKDSGGRITVNDGAFWDESMVNNPTAMTAAGLARDYVNWPQDYYNDQTGALVYDDFVRSTPDEDSGSRDLRVNLPLTSGGSARTQGDIDVDRLGFKMVSGGSILMAMGYEGLGKGIAGGGAKLDYGFASRGDGPVTGTKVRVYVVYEHIL